MLDILASELLQKKALKIYSFVKPQNKDVGLYVVSQKAQKCNYGSHFIFFLPKLLVTLEIDRVREGGLFQPIL